MQNTQNLAAKKIQQFWRQWNQKGAITTVGKKLEYWQKTDLGPTEEFQNSEADFFVHGHTEAKISLKPQLLDELLHAFQTGDLENPIFKSHRLPYLALSLLINGRINYYQTCTLLEFFQTTKSYPLKEVVPLFDASGEFTARAKELLVLMITKKSTYGDRLAEDPTWIEEQLGALKTSLQETQELEDGSQEEAIRTSEYVMYLTEENGILSNSLGKRLSEFVHPLAIHETDGIVHMTAGLRYKLMEILYGENHVPVFPRLGSFSINEIEEAVRASRRYGFIDYPGVSPFPTKSKEIHGHKTIDGFLGFAHDVYHSMVHTRLESSMVALLLRCVDQFRENVGLRWSKEIWEAIDQEFNVVFEDIVAQGSLDKEAFLCNGIFQGAVGSGIFLEILDKSVTPEGNTASLSFSKYPTCFGMSMIFDMAENSSFWTDELQINFSQLDAKSLLAENFLSFKRIQHLLSNDSFKEKCLKFYFYLILKAHKITFDPDQLPVLFEKLSEIIPKESVTLRKMEQKQGLSEKNSIKLEINGKILIDEIFQMSFVERTPEEVLEKFKGIFSTQAST